jgi:glucokinase
MTRSLRPAVLAVDVGGTRVKGAWQDRDGATWSEWTAPTPVRDDPDQTIAELVSLIAQAAARPPAGTQAVAVGIAVPGLVDERRGLAIHSENLGWRDRDLGAMFAAATGLPVALSQDVRAGARAEVRALPDGEAVSALFVPIGTGIGGAVILDGEVRAGPGNRAGELGHVRVGDASDACRCGRSGCLEAIASAVAIRRQYSERTGRDRDAAAVVELAGQGDPDAQAVWTRAIDALARVLSAADALLDLQIIVLGGGVSLAGDRLVGPLRAALLEHGSLDVDVRVGRYGDRAGSLGAGLRAWELVP